MGSGGYKDLKRFLNRNGFKINDHMSYEKERDHYRIYYFAKITKGIEEYTIYAPTEYTCNNKIELQGIMTPYKKMQFLKPHMSMIFSFLIRNS